MKPEVKLKAAILNAFVLMTIMSSFGFWMMELPKQPAGRGFEDGFRLGFHSTGASRSIIGAGIFCGIAALRRSRWTFLGAVILVLLAGNHFRHYAAAFPSWNDALLAQLPALIYSLLLSPSTWLQYFLAYRVYRGWLAINDDDIIQAELA